MDFSAEGPVVKFSKEVIDLGLKHWRNDLIVYFIKNHLPFLMVHIIVMRQWNQFGLIEVLFNNFGCFFISF